MDFLHVMIRISNIEESLTFYCTYLGLKEVRRMDVPEGRFTLIFLSTPDNQGSEIELTYNWDSQQYDEGRNFGHLAFRVDNIYHMCEKLINEGVTINRPPRDGHMAFVRSPDNISIELLQKGEPLPKQEPWVSMQNTGHW